MQIFKFKKIFFLSVIAFTFFAFFLPPSITIVQADAFGDAVKAWTSDPLNLGKAWSVLNTPMSETPLTEAGKKSGINARKSAAEKLLETDPDNATLKNIVAGANADLAALDAKIASENPGEDNDICYLDIVQGESGTKAKIFVGGMADVNTKNGLTSTKNGFENLTSNEIIVNKKGKCVGELPVDGVEISWTEGIMPNNWVPGIFTGIFKAIYKLASWTSYLLSYILDSILDNPITTDEAFIPGWVQVRNLGNMAIVLGFILVGIATALRIRSYEAGKLLPKLIIAALLINFSGLIVGVVIDTGNLVTTGLINNKEAKPGDEISDFPAPAIGEYLLYKMNAVTQDALSQNLYNGNKTRFISTTICFTFVYAGMALTFLYLGGVMIARYAILILLFVISPLALVAWIFPASESKFKEWWSQLLKWAFVGVFASFVLWLAIPLASAIGEQKNWVGVFVSTFVVLAFLWIGFKATSKQSGIAATVAGAVMGAVGAAASFAAGGVGKLAGAGLKGLDDATGNRVSSAWQERKLAAQRTLENMNLGGPKGSALAKQGKLIEERAASFQSRFDSGDEDAIIRIARGNGVNAAAARSVLAGEGRLSAIRGENFNTDLTAKDRMIATLEADERMGVKSALRKAREKDHLLAGQRGLTGVALNDARESQLLGNLQSMPNEAKARLAPELFLDPTGAPTNLSRRMSANTIQSFQTVSNAPLRTAIRNAVDRTSSGTTPGAIKAHSEKQAAAFTL